MTESIPARGELLRVARREIRQSKARMIRAMGVVPSCVKWKVLIYRGEQLIDIVIYPAVERRASRVHPRKHNGRLGKLRRVMS